MVGSKSKVRSNGSDADARGMEEIMPMNRLRLRLDNYMEQVAVLFVVRVATATATATAVAVAGCRMLVVATT